MADTYTLYTTKPILPRPAEQPIHQPTNQRLHLRPFKTSDLDDFHTLRNQYDVMKYTSKGVVDATLDETKEWMNRFLEAEDAFPLPPRFTSTSTSTSTSTLNEAAKPSADTVEVKTVSDPTAPVPDRKQDGPNYYSFVVEYVEDNGSTRIVGTMGCLNVNIEPSIGYMFFQEEWGKGFASSTAKALLENWFSLKRAVVPVPMEQVERVRKLLVLDPCLGPVGRKDAPVPEILYAVTESTNAASGRILQKFGFNVEKTYSVDERGAVATLLDWYRVQKPAERYS